MPAYTFNAQQYEPAYGGGGKQMSPCKKQKVVIVDSRQEPTKDGKGGFLAFDLRAVDGPLTGQEQTDRLNLHNINPQTVEIANKQLSAYCHVLGVYAIQATEQLHNIPFLVDIDWQKGQAPTQEKPEGGYTQVVALYDVNGNPPGKAGTGPRTVAPPAPIAPPAGVTATSAPPNGGGWQPPPQPAAAPPPPPNAGGWQQNGTAAPPNNGWGAR